MTTRVCDLNTGLGQLSQAFTELKESWAAAKDHWDDAASRHFEEQHLAPIVPRLTQVITSVQKLQEVVAEAVHELDDRPELD